MTDKVLCRYFALNACKKGDACPFSHNLKDQPSNVCTFYLRGNCTYGSNCRYEHVSARKLADTRGWGPLAGKISAGGYSASEISPGSVLAPTVGSPTSEHDAKIGSPVPIRPSSGENGHVNGVIASANGGPVPASWAAMAANSQREKEAAGVKSGTEGRGTENVSKGPVSLEASVRNLENGHLSQSARSEGVQSVGVLNGKANGHVSKPEGSVSSSEGNHSGSRTEHTRTSSEEEFDVQKGAWRPPHLQEEALKADGSERKETPDNIPHSISPGLNSSARAFSPSAYQGQYVPPAGYPQIAVPTPGGAVLMPPYGLTDENGVPYDDNALPDELWDWVDQMTITDQDAAMNAYDMQGIAYVPGQPYPQAFSPSPPLPYIAGPMYPQSYSPGPYYPEQYAHPYSDGLLPQPYHNPAQVYHANPPPQMQAPPQPVSSQPEKPKAPEVAEPTGLVRNNSLEDFPHLASPTKPDSNGNGHLDGANSNSDTSDTAPICPFAAAGDCPREKDGGTCSQLHGDKCPSCGKRCLHPERPEERKEHLEACERRSKKLKQLQRSQEVECCVCLERVLSKQRVAERKFGILSGCDHAFCIACIRGWRSGDHTSPGMDLDTVVRSCPVCRVQSFFVTPSVVWYSNPEEKEQILEGYKRKLQAIDCRHFNYGDGSCPFGTSCFYRHRFKDGREEEVVLRHLGTADGTVTIAKSVRLSDFIDLTAIKKRK